jgi:sterol desaturase/sphingolipid hydroxylase (fatty acid hydroxylase superfamily)
LEILTGLAVSALLTVFTIIVCTLIEQIGVIERYSLRSRLSGLAMNLVQGPLTTLLAWPFGQFLHSLEIGAVITIPLWTWLSPLGAVGYAIQVLILIMIVDFLTYCRHRLEHKLFWPIHMVHHSPRELYAANDVGHPLQFLYSTVVISIPLSLIQFEGPGVPGVASFILLILSYYIHSPIDAHFGPFRKVLVDNRFHRIHHSIDPRHFDKNFGVCFSLWDNWFGTAYYPAPEEWPEVGLEDVEPPRTIRDYLLIPFRRAVASIETDAASCVNCANSEVSSPTS